MTPTEEYYVVTLDFGLGAIGKSLTEADAGLEKTVQKIAAYPGLKLMDWEASLSEETRSYQSLKKRPDHPIAPVGDEGRQEITVYASLRITYRGWAKSFEDAVSLCPDCRLRPAYDANIVREADGAEERWSLCWSRSRTRDDCDWC